VTSADRTGTDLSLTNLGKPFLNMRKNKGPKTEHRTHHVQILFPVAVVILPFSLYSNVL
jgi:hypothetical protein